MKNPAPTRLRDADPRGRVDVAAFRFAENMAEKAGAKDFWNGGLGDFVETVIQGTVPSKPITGQDVARALGLAGRKQR